MPVNHAEKAFFTFLKDNKPKIDNFHSLEQIRVITKNLFQNYSGPAASVPYKDELIKVRDGNNVRVRIFNPAIKEITIFFLGGNAFLFDLFESNAIAASRLAYFGKFKVVILDYRLMPENPWPTSINDIEDVMTTMCRNSDQYAIDPNFIYLSGICSGAHAATLMALRKNFPFTIQKLILLNGLYDQSLSQNSYARSRRNTSKGCIK